MKVAIPSNRVNVSYGAWRRRCRSWWRRGQSRNPLKSGQCFLPCERPCKAWVHQRMHVAIPSNRVNVSYSGFFILKGGLKCFASQSPQIGSMFLTRKPRARVVHLLVVVAIPSNRVNVSSSTHLFLRIIGNLTPRFREPHYFYAFVFPI